ncbi:MAG: biliverdin reductase BvdR [Phormidesmis priestleyi Ana]|uniref:Biliverdin reductase BvdR n=1 Tax=Phormidesmis priestleyi Ana TaxID=1666911 RepID=A0A0P7YS84_9CYAN|nr:MAG: biliverdin reductase BvdR [Phormidesmis priestleyi Ana]
MSIRVGLVGTGYAARVRAQALTADERSHLVVVSGHQNTASFATAHSLEVAETWQQLIANEAIDLVIVATVSSLHGEIVEAALQADKHVVVEYPLSLDLAQARRLVALAAERKRLLHVEHIELLGGLHLAMKAHLPKVGLPSYVSYRTLNPQHPAPKKWTYCPALFGPPFYGALSRVHRLTNLFGRVVRVECCTQTVEDAQHLGYFKSILSSARLQFEQNGLVAELTYGKGEAIWIRRRDIEVQGSLGGLSFVGNEGLLTTAEGTWPIAVAPRKGLFVKDTACVLDYLTMGKPLYVSAEESVYALSVADALWRSAQQGEAVYLPSQTRTPGLF